MNTLRKTRAILDFDGVVTHRTGREMVKYESDQENARPTMMFIDTEVYVDMGQPQQITVTVEPDDMLNDVS